LVRPYQDNDSVRTFNSNVDSSELVWHRDREDRTITVLEGNGWSFQYDDSLPFELKQGDQFFIEKMTYHRLLKGTNQLRVLIEKHYG
jgi:quercetin dioxygenase-like cupin family protein